jgi:hypothetical protein
LTRVTTVLAVGGLEAHTPAWAQGDGWSFVVTPQVWISHIAKNGFASAPNSANTGGLAIGTPTSPTTVDIQQQPFPSQSSPNEVLDPQWGIQFAAQKGRWTLAGAFQYVSFETRNDISYFNPAGTPFCFMAFCIDSGQPYAQELVDTTRMDVDLSGSYFFPDVVKDRVDVSLGAGFKFIYASASRQYSNLSTAAASINAGLFGAGPGLYSACPKDSITIPASSATVSNPVGLLPPNCQARDRVDQQSYLYAATFPINATLHLTHDAKWLLPFNVTPLLGAEIRNDNNVVYSSTFPSTVNFLQPNTIKINRQDGAALAYGVTADATVRWIITEMVSAYAGMRVQYINGHDEYLAYGPLVGMSVRFGGK